jgi:catechol 2,3-dioxygenase-like lactoylglutathione lyase family enzyme
LAPAFGLRSGDLCEAVTPPCEVVEHTIDVVGTGSAVSKGRRWRSGTGHVPSAAWVARRPWNGVNEIHAAKEDAMAEHATPATCGVDHVGLSVQDLESTRRFFCDCLGWRIVGERPEYPAAFVSDGQQIVTLWRVEAPDQAVAFDRRTNVGLHHLALAVADRAGLDSLYERVASWPGVVVEFAPELSGKGPKIHFIVREPSGIRIEFASDPRVERSR